MKADKLKKRLWNLEIKQESILEDIAHLRKECEKIDDEINEVYRELHKEMEQNKTAPNKRGG